MMKDIYKALTALLLIISLLYFFIIHEKEAAKNEIIIDKQQEQIKVQNEVIKEQKQVFQRKVINKSFSTDANLQWLHDNICQDCKSR